MGKMKDAVMNVGSWVKNKAKSYKDDPENIKKDAKAVGKYIKDHPSQAAELIAGYTVVPWAIKKGLGKSEYFKKHAKLANAVAVGSGMAPIGEAMVAADIMIRKKLEEKKKNDKH